MIIAASVLSLILINSKERKIMRRRNYTGFIISALVVHIIGPLITATKEMYFFSMPLPWSSLTIQVFNNNTAFHENFTNHWGLAGLSALLAFVILYNVIVLAGTLLFGRRLQCSQLCLFNGFASEIFSAAFPLTGKTPKKAGRALQTFFTTMRIVLIAAAVFFTFTAALSAAGIITGANNPLLYKIETYKYLFAELLMAMFFWIVFTGRGYCYFCPAGTVLAFISKAADQKIRTDLNNCISCRKCDSVCPMSINISSRANDGLHVKSMNCVGCGHCVDACPTRTLGYSTRFLDFVRARRIKINPAE